MTPVGPFVRRWIGRLLIGIGAALVAWCVVERVRAEAYQQRHARQFTDAAAHDANAPGTTPGGLPAVGEPIGILELPRLRLSAVVLHGESDAILKKAIGHLADTPLPWDGGNTALAAHRDTFFRPLEHIRPGDLVRLETPHGDFHYRVSQTLVVDPEDVWVLDPSAAPTLTLITCYPFRYVGSAPQRFIVRAERLPKSS